MFRDAQPQLSESGVIFHLSHSTHPKLPPDFQAPSHSSAPSCWPCQGLCTPRASVLSHLSRPPAVTRMAACIPITPTRSVSSSKKHSEISLVWQPGLVASFLLLSQSVHGFLSLGDRQLQMASRPRKEPSTCIQEHHCPAGNSRGGDRRLLLTTPCTGATNRGHAQGPAL